MGRKNKNKKAKGKKSKASSPNADVSSCVDLKSLVEPAETEPSTSWSTDEEESFLHPANAAFNDGSRSGLGHGTCSLFFFPNLFKPGSRTWTSIVRFHPIPATTPRGKDGEGEYQQRLSPPEQSLWKLHDPNEHNLFYDRNNKEMETDIMDLIAHGYEMKHYRYEVQSSVLSALGLCRTIVTKSLNQLALEMHVLRNGQAAFEAGKLHVTMLGTTPIKQNLPLQEFGDYFEQQNMKTPEIRAHDMMSNIDQLFPHGKWNVGQTMKTPEIRTHDTVWISLFKRSAPSSMLLPPLLINQLPVIAVSVFHALELVVGIVDEHELNPLLRYKDYPTDVSPDPWFAIKSGDVIVFPIKCVFAVSHGCSW